MAGLHDLAVCACLVGLSSSYCFDWPYGPTLVLSLGLVFVCAVFLRAFLPASARERRPTS